MNLGDKKASEALEEHLRRLVPTEPDALWLFLRPTSAAKKNFVEKLTTWAATVDWPENDERKRPRRPGVRRVLLELRTEYLDMLDMYEIILETNPKFPHDIYTKKQITKVRAVISTPTDLHPEESYRLILSMVDVLPYRKTAGATKIRVAGVAPHLAIQALVYWCFKENP